MGNIELQAATHFVQFLLQFSEGYNTLSVYTLSPMTEVDLIGTINRGS